MTEDPKVTRAVERTMRLIAVADGNVDDIEGALEGLVAAVRNAERYKLRSEISDRFVPR